MTELVQLHPAAEVTAPDGAPITVDIAVLPLVRQLWKRGWTTLGSCQDMGEASRHGGAPGGERTGAYYAGYAWLKLGNDDADAFLAAVAADPRFTDRVSPRPGPEHWYCFSFRDHRGLFTSTQIFFPSAQIDDVTAVLAGPAAGPDAPDAGAAASDDRTGS
ncbi:hypothetical protein [Actinomadura violacea]|uniref:Uncharacterized protein n=1 Tax=Actinomadura violacea TaxID=2819934 RepID=A0ABS3RXL8_9ACTN|nr:hypothetical protein [Actinomadura violacea]MBO2461509.1 hypothetical protein [Actinomadura violacea]